MKFTPGRFTGRAKNAIVGRELLIASLRLPFTATSVDYWDSFSYSLGLTLAGGTFDYDGLEEMLLELPKNWNIISALARTFLLEAVIFVIVSEGVSAVTGPKCGKRLDNLPPLINFVDVVLKELLPFIEESLECATVAKKVWGNQQFIAVLMMFVKWGEFSPVLLPAMKLLLSFLDRSPTVFRHVGLFVTAQERLHSLCKIAEESSRVGHEETTLIATRIISLISCSRLIYSDRMVLTGPLYEAVTSWEKKDELCTYLFSTLAFCAAFKDPAVAMEVYTICIESIGNLCMAPTQPNPNTPMNVKGSLLEEVQSSRLLYHLLDALYVSIPGYSEQRPYCSTNDDKKRNEGAEDDCMARDLHDNSNWTTSLPEDLMPRFPVWPNRTDVLKERFSYPSTDFSCSGFGCGSADKGIKWKKRILQPRLDRNEPQYATNNLLLLLNNTDFLDIVSMAATLLVEYLRNADLLPQSADTRPKMNERSPCKKPQPMLEILLSPSLRHLADYTIIAQEREIKVCKCILAAYVPYFASLFEYEPNTTQTEFTESAEVVDCWVRYLYTCDEKLINSIENASGLLRIADRLCQDRLIQDCEMYLFNHMDKENLDTIYKLAAQCNAHSLVEACATFSLRLLPDKLNQNTSGIWWLRGNSMLIEPDSEPVVPKIPLMDVTVSRASNLVKTFFEKVIRPDGSSGSADIDANVIRMRRTQNRPLMTESQVFFIL